jgi:hypothetical protein
MNGFNQLVTEGAAITAYDLDPDATTTVDVAWVDMRDYSKLAVMFFRTVGTSDLTLSIIGNSAANGGGSDVTVKTKTLTSVQPNAVGDYTFIEVSEDEVVAASESGARYLSANVSLATSTDEGVVVYIRTGAKYPQSGLTADSIA